MSTKTAAATHTENLIPVYLPPLPDEGGSQEVDQTVVVTINGHNTVINRGNYVSVTPEVYEALQNSNRFDRL